MIFTALSDFNPPLHVLTSFYCKTSPVQNKCVCASTVCSRIYEKLSFSRRTFTFTIVEEESRFCQKVIKSKIMFTSCSCTGSQHQICALPKNDLKVLFSKWFPPPLDSCKILSLVYTFKILQNQPTFYLYQSLTMFQEWNSSSNKVSFLFIDFKNKHKIMLIRWVGYGVSSSSWRIESKPSQNLIKP